MTDETDLPPGWASVRLGDVAESPRPKVQPDPGSELPFVGMDSIEPNSLSLGKLYSFAQMKSAGGYFEPGDVLYGRMRPYLNKVHMAQICGACSAEFIVFPASKAIDPGFLTYLLHNRDFVVFASGKSSGDRPRVDISDLAPFSFGLPPLSEQRRIVEKIDELFSLVEAGEQALARARTLLERYRQSVLNAAVTGELTKDWRERHKGEIESGADLLKRILKARREAWEKAELAKVQARGKTPTNDTWKKKYKEPQPPDTSTLPELPEGWVWTSLDQLADPSPNSLTDGPFGSNLMTKHYTETGPRVIRLENIGHGQFIDARAHISEAHYSKLEKHKVEVGDVLIASLGSPLPRACLLPGYVEKAIVKAYCIRFLPFKGLVYPAFVSYCLNSDVIQKAAENTVHGVGRPRLNLSDIRKLPVPLTGTIEQSEICDFVEAQLSECGAQESDAENQKSLSIALRQAILAAAFSGKLVPQDPADEPASVLLERIREERAKGAAKPRQRPGNRSRKLAAQLP